MANDTPTDPKQAGVALPQRHIPWPLSVSPEARAMLANAATQPVIDWPPLGDRAAWAARIAAADAMMDRFADAVPQRGLSVEEARIDGALVYRARPDGHDPADRRVYLDLHGGGFVTGGGRYTRACAMLAVYRHGVEAVSVDYRMPPAHPYPAGLDDCVAVYRALVASHGAGNIIVGGASAGGNLAPALLLRAREEGLPMPAALVLMTPAVDLTESGDTFSTLAGLDPVLNQKLGPLGELYAGGHRLDDPLLSPLFGDLTGFPPTFLQSGTRDLFLSNTVRMHRALRAAGVKAELHIFEGMPHGGFFGAPEDAARDQEVAQFVAAHWGRD